MIPDRTNEGTMLSVCDLYQLGGQPAEATVVFLPVGKGSTEFSRMLFFALFLSIGSKRKNASTDTTIPIFSSALIMSTIASAAYVAT